MKAFILFVLASIVCLGQSSTPAPTYVGFYAGSQADLYHGPVRSICTFSGSIATNPPCLANYLDTSLTVGTLIYGYAGLPFSYTIPVSANGTCDILLSAFEPNKTSPGQRVFSVEIPGKSPVTVDLVALAGTKLLYSWIIPAVPVVDTLIHINFRPIIGNAVISSITWNCHLLPAQ